MSRESVLNLLKDLDENKTLRQDNLSGKSLKDGASVLAKLISQICNLSIAYSKFLFDYKIVKLKPLFRKGSKTAPKNYCSVSLLPQVSKIIEKPQSFLGKNDIIYRFSKILGNFFPLTHVYLT